MTRQVTITNTSNWDGENYYVKMGDDIKHIRPGESIVFAPVEGSAVVFQESVEDQQPFYINKVINGRRKDFQVVPTVKVEFE